MTGYVRQRDANIVNGGNGNASDVKAELDQVQFAFNTTTGHKHDGSSGEGAPITVAGAGQDYIFDPLFIKPKITATYDLGSSSFKFKDGYFSGSVSVGGVAITPWTQVGPFNTGSGTAFDVNGIPSGVTEIEIMFDFVSLSGTDAILVQLGAFGVGSLDATGYQSATGVFSGTTIPSPGIINDSVNPGIVVRANAAANAVVGTLRLVRGSNVALWHHTLLTGLDGVTMQIGAGRKYLSTTRLSDLRITRSGTNTFDNGLISVRYR